MGGTVVSYASNTSVTEDRSRQEIERLLMKYGASRFGCMTDYDHRVAIIEFSYRKIVIQMRIPLPDRQGAEICLYKQGSTTFRRTDSAIAERYGQEIRRRWRSLSLALKAKLVAVEDGITTFETEFMPYMVTDDGRTVAERFGRMIVQAQRTGRLALPAPGAEDTVVDAEFMEAPK
jgi:hypothetical protein